MQTRIWSATCAAIALGTTITVLAQTPPSPQTDESKSPSAKTVTVTGCVQRAQEGPTGTSGASEPASGANEPKFVLTNASLNPKETEATSGAAAPSETAIASEYRLDTDEAKLTPHVGHKVEITGTVEKPKAGEQPPASAAKAPTLKVDNIKMVASTCP